MITRRKLLVLAAVITLTCLSSLVFSDPIEVFGSFDCCGNSNCSTVHALSSCPDNDDSKCDSVEHCCEDFCNDPGGGN